MDETEVVSNDQLQKKKVDLDVQELPYLHIQLTFIFYGLNFINNTPSIDLVPRKYLEMFLMFPYNFTCGK